MRVGDRALRGPARSGGDDDVGLHLAHIRHEGFEKTVPSVHDSAESDADHWPVTEVPQPGWWMLGTVGGIEGLGPDRLDRVGAKDHESTCRHGGQGSR